MGQNTEGEPVKEPRIQADIVAFDWGNTLVMDPFPNIVRDIAVKIVESLHSAVPDFQVSPTDILETWSRVNKEVNFPYASHFAQEEVFIQHALKQLGFPDAEIPILSPEILVMYREEFRKRLENDTELQNELKTTFLGLYNKGKKIAVLSNDRASTPRSTLAWLGVAHLVSAFVTSEEVRIEKPDPVFFNATAERVGLKLKGMVYVGDDPVRDVDGAHKAGVKAILFIPKSEHQSSTSWRDYSTKPEHAPEAIIHKLSELVNIIV